MTNQPKPNVVAGLLSIHAAISRGLEVGAERATAYAGQGFPNAETRNGFLDYVRALASAIHAHHLTEDELAFPYFRDKLHGAPFDLLSEQHKDLVPLIGEIDLAIETCGDEARTAEGCEQLAGVLNKIRSLWYPHIGIEEEHFSYRRFEDLRLTDEESLRLVREFGEHNGQHALPPELVVPFTLYNLAPEQRAIMESLLPPEVTQQLVPVVWKEKWAPMKEFLLD